MRVVFIASALLLTGCISLPAATPPPIIPAPTPAQKSVPCVDYEKIDPRSFPPATYDAEFAKASAALDAAKPPGYQVIDGFLTDYHNMRIAAGCPSSR
ncbi:MAG TPA: hypothetical protein VGH23_16090 [Rhizomicrobium sp.]|jgi:hypothetical protein